MNVLSAHPCNHSLPGFRPAIYGEPGSWRCGRFTNDIEERHARQLGSIPPTVGLAAQDTLGVQTGLPFAPVPHYTKSLTIFVYSLTPDP
jgi:hypothetical protein